MRVSAIIATLAFALCGCTEEHVIGRQGDAAPKPTLELTGRVVDEAGILSPAFEDSLTVKLEKLEDDTLVQLVVATTPDLKGASIEEYSLNLANAWGIGSKDRDDGLLITVAPNERRVRIEVGRGLEASVKDEEAASVINEAMLPMFSKGNFEQGVDRGVDRLIDEVIPYELREAA